MSFMDENVDLLRLRFLALKAENEQLKAKVLSLEEEKRLIEEEKEKKIEQLLRIIG